MPTLVGRDPELATIDCFLRSLREGYQAVVFRGGAGYGKSALLEETFARARATDCRALTARPAETETELPFGVLAELLEPVATSELDLPAPQVRALEVALRRADADEEHPIDPLGLSLAIATALRELAAQQPLLVGIDDLQWCDPPSLRLLEFALRRVDSEQIGLVAGLRSGNGLEIPVANGRLSVVEVGPLDESAFESVVRRATRLPRPVLRQLYVACDGNPLFGKEVAALLAEHGLPDDPAALIPVPPSASVAIGRRVEKRTPMAGRRVPSEITRILVATTRSIRSWVRVASAGTRKASGASTRLSMPNHVYPVSSCSSPIEPRPKLTPSGIARRSPLRPDSG